jgi:hypothetical protein
MLLYLGIHNINILNNNMKPIIILPLLFGGFMIHGILRYIFISIFVESPRLILLGIIINISLLLIGSVNLMKAQKIKEPNDF